KRRRLRRWAKWACTLAAVLALTFAMLTRFWSLQYVLCSEDRTDIRVLEIGTGLLSVTRIVVSRPLPPVPSADWGIAGCHAWHWGLQVEGPVTGLTWPWRAGICWDSRGRGGWERGVSLVYPILIAAIPALLLWHVDRRGPGPHQCAKCGY